MVAKKTAVQQSASGSSGTAEASGGAAKDVGGKKSAQGDGEGRADKAVKTVGGAARKAAAKSPAKKTAAKKATAKATESKAAPARKTVEEEEPERPAAKKAAAKKTAAKKAAKKTAASNAAVKKTTAAKSTSTKSTSTKSAAGKSTAKKAGAAQAAKQTGATTVVAKKTSGTATAAKTAVPKARLAAAVVPGELAVRPGEDPWTPEEIAEARAELQSEVLRLGSEITTSEESLVGLMRDSGGGAGDDEADTGTKNITREHEMSLAANAREMLEQSERALQRLDAGTYGLCENCGNAIGKARMQAFPRATLCVECKQKQERRY
ncbi:TraR/DksA family transcriptional regulator [Streptomyces sp. S3(2020)]|uniref:TraR/DksA family transcriptional regulator n=1 Tax=Streptomyces sp. S3(2020) TaxID=2732044 RepID=UPI00148A0CFC|nr:TraR/DksA family transcriptional regulator [Streptomyces sp. S3(2020)]NNN35140.1 TraR/DksA family transcriptional regulator [Streptomyces sp. S3(2020)]